jgi:hypothetical protein
MEEKRAMTEEEKEDIFHPLPHKEPEYYPASILNPKIRFQTFHVVNREGKEVGQITAAVLKDGNRFFMSCSFCSPKDQFNREFGKFVAFRRLMYSPEGRGSVVSFYQPSAGQKVITLIKHNCLVLASHYPVRWMLQEVDSIDQLK